MNAPEQHPFAQILLAYCFDPGTPMIFATGAEAVCDNPPPLPFDFAPRNERLARQGDWLGERPE